MAKFYIKQNDTSPALDVTFLPTRDFTGFQAVVFNMWLKSDNTVKVNRAAGAAIDASVGNFKYTWAAADTDTAGIYEGEFEITLSDGSIETYPNGEYIEIVITDDIA